MLKKRLFQVFDEMNVNDDKNKTATLGCCFEMVEAKTVKAGGIVTMGVPKDEITRIFLGERQSILLLMDKKEYHRLEAIPLEDKVQAAEEKAAKYEKALKVIETLGDGATIMHLRTCKKVANEALSREEEKEAAKPMEYNVCETCGAGGGKAGILINNECRNCYETRKTGAVTIHTNLERTQDEIDKTIGVLNQKEDKQ